MRWYSKELVEIENKLSALLNNGLSDEKVKKSIEIHGANVLTDKPKKSFIARFIAQFKDLLVIILMVTAVISFVLGEWIDSVVILTIVILNAILGVIQEQKAEASIEAIKKLSSPHAKVIRNGGEMVIDSKDVVVGDTVILEAGDFVPADMRLFETISLQIEESSLTGESVPSDKSVNVLPDQEIGIGDRDNMAFSGSVITYGRGKGIVTEVGMKTQMGHIAQMIEDVEESLTPLQIRLEEVGKWLAIVAISLCLGIFVLSYLQSNDLVNSFLLAVSLAVAAIPEGLTVIVTIILALGIQEMARNNAIMRTLPAVETAGSASVICSDKTGTLTQNKMTVVESFVNLRENETIENETFSRFAKFGVLCNDTKIVDGGTNLIGDPTETSLVDFAIKLSFDALKLNQDFIRVNELPFDSERKMMSTVNKIDGKYYFITKGAPDVLLSRSKFIEIDGVVIEINDDIRELISNHNEKMSSEALRVLALCYYEINESDIHSIVVNESENNFIFVGLYGIIDPEREEAKAAIAECFNAGIRPVMITGDHKTTAVAIAKKLGIINSDSLSMTGQELDVLSDDELVEVVKTHSVFARVSPEHKVRIVHAWQKNGAIVAMTGDGVNDAPALKNADIGVAMGITGTEVSKGAADMILVDDNFATIVASVKVGRVIFENIRKAIQFLLSSNVGEIIAILLGILFMGSVTSGHGSILEPTQILWINLVTDSFLAIALGLEAGEDSVMKEQPRNPKASIFSGGLGGRILYQGLMFGVLTFSAFWIGYNLSGEIIVAQTMAFMTLAFVQFVHSFNVRSMQKSLFKMGFFTNKWLNYAVLAAMLLQLGTMLPIVRDVFGVVPLSFNYWMIILGLSLLPLLIVEIEKIITK